MVVVVAVVDMLIRCADDACATSRMNRREANRAVAIVRESHKYIAVASEEDRSINESIRSMIAEQGRAHTHEQPSTSARAVGRGERLLRRRGNETKEKRSCGLSLYSPPESRHRKSLDSMHEIELLHRITVQHGEECQATPTD